MSLSVSLHSQESHKPIVFSSARPAASRSVASGTMWRSAVCNSSSRNKSTPHVSAAFVLTLRPSSSLSMLVVRSLTLVSCSVGYKACRALYHCNNFCLQVITATSRISSAVPTPPKWSDLISSHNTSWQKTFITPKYIWWSTSTTKHSAGSRPSALENKGFRCLVEYSRLTRQNITVFGNSSICSKRPTFSKCSLGSSLSPATKCSNVTVARRGAWGGSPAERPEGGSPSEGPGVVVPASPWVTAAAAVGSGVPWGGSGRRYVGIGTFPTDYTKPRHTTQSPNILYKDIRYSTKPKHIKQIPNILYKDSQYLTRVTTNNILTQNTQFIISEECIY